MVSRQLVGPTLGRQFVGTIIRGATIRERATIHEATISGTMNRGMFALIVKILDNKSHKTPS